MAAAKASPAIKVAAICGSLRKASLNHGLLRCAVELCDEGAVEGVRVELVDLLHLPFVNPDLEVSGGYPKAVEDFRQRISEADAVLFAFPEYNYSLPALLKNAVDWGSRPPNVWAGKAAAMVSVAGGSGGVRSQLHLRQVGVFVDLHFLNKPEIYIRARDPPNKFDNQGNLVDLEIRDKLKNLLSALRSYANKLHG